jgi:hypothetical protein
MSVSAVSPNPQVYQPNAQQNQFRQDFQALTNALQSGDLSTAQTAYQTLISDNPQLTATSGNSNNPFQQAIAAIGSALQNGDIGGAQNALSSLQSNMKAHHGHHHHGGGASATNATDPTTASTNPLSGSGSSIDFVA